MNDFGFNFLMGGENCQFMVQAYNSFPVSLEDKMVYTDYISGLEYYLHIMIGVKAYF